jgi:tungstate transport system substrate-binding protein
VGTGNAISNAKRGDGDVLMVHSKKDELKFVSDGFGVKRHELMYNNFIIVGPKDDPAKISQENDIKNIMKKISLSNQKFISRDDNSGTHIKENDLWKLSNINLFDNHKYIKTGLRLDQ